MASEDTRHTARKNAARALASRTGMPYAAALRQVTRAAEPRRPRDRWVLTDDVRAWFAGDSWRNISYLDLYDWLDTQVSPTYECDWCAEPGDARTVDSTLELVITAYDPDVAPVTSHLATRKYHAACRPSSISWVRRADIPAGPQRIGLPASIRPQIVGEFELTARPLLLAGDDENTEQAALLVTARVVEDHQQGARPWLFELQLQLDSETDWALRIVTGYPSTLAPQWIALRIGSENATPEHLLLCALDLPSEWVQTARRDVQVILIFGPCTAHRNVMPAAPDALPDVRDDLEVQTPDSEAAGCGCAALTAEQIAQFAEEGAFPAGSIPVVSDQETLA